MKLRIQDDSIRYRLTLREVEDFAASGHLERTTQVLGPDGPAGVFRYALVHAPEQSESTVVVEGGSITLRLGNAEREALISPDSEGAYIHREWKSPEGSVRRFMAFVEKDRPAATCNKPEVWIYDSRAGEPIETRPIPKDPLK